MTRVKRSLHARKKRRATLKLAKGYRGDASRHYRTAKEAARNYDVHAYCLFGDFARPNGSLARLKAEWEKPSPRPKRRGAKRPTARPLRRNRALTQPAA